MHDNLRFLAWALCLGAAGLFQVGCGPTQQEQMAELAQQFELAVESRDEAALERLVGSKKMDFYRSNRDGENLWPYPERDAIAFRQVVSDPFRIVVGEKQDAGQVAAISAHTALDRQHSAWSILVRFVEDDGKLRLTAIDRQFVRFADRRVTTEAVFLARRERFKHCVSQMSIKLSQQCLLSGAAKECAKVLERCMSSDDGSPTPQSRAQADPPAGSLLEADTGPLEPDEARTLLQAATSRSAAREILRRTDDRNVPERWSQAAWRLHLDRTAVALPTSRKRHSIPVEAAVISLTETGQVRVTSGQELSVAIAEEDVLGFASAILSRQGIEAPTESPRRKGSVEAIAVEIHEDELVVDGASLPFEELTGHLELVLEGSPEKPLLLLPSANVAMSRVVEVLDQLEVMRTCCPPFEDLRVSLPSRRQLELFEGGGPLLEEPSSDPLPFVLKADRSVPYRQLEAVLDQLVQAGAPGVTILTEKAADSESFSGLLPGGIRIVFAREEGSVEVAVSDFNTGWR